MTRFRLFVLAALSVALSPGPVQAQQVLPMNAPPPLPPPPRAAVPPVIFSDHFPGSELASVWDVANRNPENYLVENDKLLIVARTPGGFGDDKSMNIFRLNKPIPDANWVITIKFTAEVQTWRESLMFGLIDNPQNYLAAQFYSWNSCCDSGLILRVMKVADGQTTQFDLPVKPAKAGIVPIAIRLKRDGHEYRAGLNFEGEVDKDGNPLWVETKSVASLHPPKTFAIDASQWEATKGESEFYLSAVTIEAPAR
jgi:hypothetical protein